MDVSLHIVVRVVRVDLTVTTTEDITSNSTGRHSHVGVTKDICSVTTTVDITIYGDTVGHGIYRGATDTDLMSTIWLRISLEFTYIVLFWIFNRSASTNLTNHLGIGVRIQASHFNICP